jgi:hypothetical protein
MQKIRHPLELSGCKKDSSDFKKNRGGCILPVSNGVPRSVDRDGIEPPTHGFSVHCSTN